MPRNLKGIPLSAVQSDTISVYWFVEIEIPVGVWVRYTNKPNNYGPTTNISDQNVTWTSYDVVIGAIVQNQTSPLDVSFIDLENLDNVWSNYVLVTGTRYRRCKVYQAWFDVATDAFLGSMEMFDGRLDEANVGARVKIALAPHSTSWTALIPHRRFLPTCQYIFKDPETCQYVGPDAVCLKTVEDCRARTGGSNEAHFGGFLKMPPANFKMTFGDVQIVLPYIPIPSTYFQKDPDPGVPAVPRSKLVPPERKRPPARPVTDHPSGYVGVGDPGLEVIGGTQEFRDSF